MTTELSLELIESLPAGRDIDVLVATHVMGLRVVCLDWPCGYQPDSCELEAARYRGFGASWGYQPHPVYVITSDGWPPRKIRDILPDYYSSQALEEANEERRGYMEEQLNREMCDVEPVPHYSEDIKATWLVMDVLCKRFTNVSLHAAWGWGLTVWDQVTGSLDHKNLVPPSNADTAQLTICRTALQAAMSGLVKS